MKFDLHLHTSRHSPDSQMEPARMLRRAHELGLEGLVITEHDWLWTEEELESLRALAPGLIVLAGIEVSAREGHFLVYGVTDPFALPRGIGVRDLCDVVHQQGGAVVGAHPFRWGQPFRDIVRRHQPELDGLEMMSSNMDADCRRQTAELQRELGLAELGNSDAHQEITLGHCYTKFSGPVTNNAELVAAIRGRRARPCDREGRSTGG
jgi:hypothetical protein